jgi:hypothetical protein
VYRAKIDERNRSIRFYILVEFQSESDRLMPLRLHTYQGELWQDAVKNSGISPQSLAFTLPRIVPIVIYNGKKPWKAPLRFHDLLTVSQDLQDYATVQSYILIDIHRLDPKKLLEQGNLVGSVFLLDRADHVQDLIRLLKDLRGTIQRFNELEYGLFRNWARRILAGKLPRTSREMLLQMIDEEEVDRMITNIERVIDKALADKYRQGKQVGLAEGKKAGLAEGKKAGFAEGKRIIACKLLQKGLSPAEVSELTELPLDQVKGLMRPDQGL